MQGKTATILVIVIVLLLGFIGFAIFFNNGKVAIPFTSEKAEVSGTFNINGVIPDGGTITLTQKEVGSAQSPQVFASGIAISDGDPWSFNGAQSGKNYVVQADVVVNGQVVSTSSPIEATAPADDESLELDLTSKTQTPNAVISGNVIVNGYIPEGSTVTIRGKKLTAKNYTTVVSGTPAQRRQAVSYTTATAGTIYQVQGELVDSNGKVIGTSDTLTVAAPAANERLVINSTATAPSASSGSSSSSTSTPTPSSGSSQSQNQGSAVISGTINFNGSAPANSRIVVFAQGPGLSGNQPVVQNVPPVNGSTWSWNGAQNSAWYTLVAVLKQAQANGTDKDISTSQTVQVAAPATSVVFNINSGMSLSAPGSNINVTCQTFNNGPNQNNWTAQVNYQAIPGAQSYWLQIGTNSGGNQTQNTTVNSSGGNYQSIGVTLNNNVTYYAQYAYANIANQPVGSSQYSPFSPSVPIACGN